MGTRYTLLILLAICPYVGASTLKPQEVPTFSLRARVMAAKDQPPAGPKFSLHLGTASATTQAGEWSQWLTFDQQQAAATLKAYPAIYIDRWPVVVPLKWDGIKEAASVEAELKLDEGGGVVALKGDLFGPTLGIMLWREGDNHHAEAATMAGYNQRYWNAIKDVQLPPAMRPKHFLLIDRFIGGDDDRTNWREGIENLAHAGFTAIMLPPSRPIRSLLHEAGLTRTAWAVYSPPGYAFSDPAKPGDPPPQAPAAWAAGMARQYTDAGYDPHDLAAIAMSDEPGWYYPSTFKVLDSKEASARFHKYLQAQGLSPADLGGTSWDAIKAAGRSKGAELPSRRLFYWTMRFFAWDSARYFADCTRAMEQAFYPSIALTTNWNFFSGRLYVPGAVANNPDRQSPDSAMGGHDWLEFGRMRGCTMLWTEDWFSDAQAYQWSFYAAKLRCAAEKGGISFGGYVVPRAAGDREAGLLQKTLCLVGSGAKGINTYVFGPEYNFPGNCYSDHPEHLRKLAEAFRLIGAAEEVLWPGKRPRPQVAVLAPKSSQMWDSIATGTTPISDATNTNLNGSTVDYQAEAFDLYLALQHANVPVDFVEEEDLSPAGLAAYRVIYVTEPDVPAEGQKGLADWIRGGGRLVTVAGAARGDRYGDPCTIIADLEAVHEKPRTRLLVADLASLKPVGHFRDPEATAVGARESHDHPEGEIVMAFDDASPAILRKTVGKGATLHFAWLPGLSYARSATYAGGKLPSGFNGAVRDWIALPLHDAAVSPPVRVSSTLVESPLLLSDAGAAITLLNWNDQPIDKLSVAVDVPFKVKQARSARSGDLKFKTVAGGVEFETPLAAADIIILRP